MRALLLASLLLGYTGNQFPVPSSVTGVEDADLAAGATVASSADIRGLVGT